MNYLRVILFAAMMALVLESVAKRQRTTMPGKLQAVTSTASVADTIVCDTITTDTERYVHLSGYDKPINASRESMHVTNLTDSLVLVGMSLDITYRDRAGRMLHSRTVELNTVLEPHETELVTFPTWDVQRSFYYVRSVKPRRQATPFDVECSVKALRFKH